VKQWKRTNREDAVSQPPAWELKARCGINAWLVRTGMLQALAPESNVPCASGTSAESSALSKQAAGLVHPY